MRRELRRHLPDMLNRERIRVYPEHLVAGLEEVHEVATPSTPRVDDAHPGRNAPAKQLIEHIDVDLAKAIAKIGHVRPRTRQRVAVLTADSRFL
jgi:hypothetical protein